MEFLLEKCKLAVNATNEKGETSLYFACLNGHRDAVAVLLRADSSTAGVTEETVCANLFKFKPDDMDGANALKREILDMLCCHKENGT
jgi:ankyrin repeat protein